MAGEDTRSWVDALPDAAAVIDGDAHLVRCNPGWAQTLAELDLGTVVAGVLATGGAGEVTVWVDSTASRLHLAPLGDGDWLVLQRSPRRNPTVATGFLAAVRAGVDAEEFGVYLQPIVDVTSGRPLGAEALLRWQRAGVGLLVAEQFLAPAVAVGESNALEWIAIRRALTAAASWPPSLAGLRVFVNISPGLLHHPDTAGRVLEEMAAVGADPAAIVVELTEDSLDVAFDQAATSLHTLHEAGVAVAIDDFGTGFNALDRVGAVPVQFLKIDSGLVLDVDTDHRAQQIIAGIRSLATRIDAAVVAEGVERHAQAEALVDLDVTYQQGFLHAAAMPPEQLTATVGPVGERQPPLE